MGDKSKIEWTEATWNPVRGCSKVSEGCRNCYAMSVAARFSGPGQPYEGLAHRVGGQAQWTNKIMLVEDALALPLRWQKPRRIFVNSMSDLFHEGIPDEYIDRVFAVMALAPQHTFQVLTKRPERSQRWFREPRKDLTQSRDMVRMQYGRPARFFPSEFARLPLNQDPMAFRWPLPNVWLGVSVEDQPTADARIPLLLETPAAVRWVSYEPALGPVDFRPFFIPGAHPPNKPEGYDDWPEARQKEHIDGMARAIYMARCHNLLHWIVCGGESGPNARPMHPEWARKTRDACQQAGVPFFFKQWGEYGPVGIDHRPCVTRIGGDDIIGLAKIGKKAAGRILDKRTWDEYPGGGS